MPLLKRMRLGPETSISDNNHQAWDVFSAVVDNYGDIGVCWRLSRQLVAEYRINVRLWVDCLASFQKICPEIDPLQQKQQCHGVEIRQWTDPFPSVEPADVVVEAFGCKLPANYVEAMASGGRRHIWINLEYLSAEEWVDSYHGLISPHPQLPLAKHFFFPGFSPMTGGLLVEKGLADRRRNFQACLSLKEEFWRGIGLPVPENEETRVSLFCYENKAVSNLFSGWAKGKPPVVCLVPEGVATEQIERFFGHSSPVPGNMFKKGGLTVCVISFLEQDSYDTLLWACDFNFVRGEDSFVRAQLAAQPMAWQIYPQEEGAHWPKLNAFLARYCCGLSPDAAERLVAFSEKWNRGEADGADWEKLWIHRAELENHARDWADKQEEKEDLATNLVNFCNSKLK
ncbi:MAG: elongation factor P maturation arginine rhamnosyltransferase EarP [Betaproteobacteria bacterium]|nr:elongation factor P maturation arginine rhamnosyltransferase EarP [Betaproteobacteria bacterium]